ncbi:MAG: 50S ribosomal protein L22 [Candidatus Brocadiia bacterium]|nr:50S ribosomal protein L22 [Candidatus Brocadiia bacterium]
MQFRATHKKADISPRKVKGVVRLIRGRHVNDALQILRATDKRASHLVDRVLRSAMANADQSMDADMEALFVAEARVDEGPHGGPEHMRWRFRARGRAAPIRHRTSHIAIVIDDGQEQKQAEQ